MHFLFVMYTSQDPFYLKQNLTTKLVVTYDYNLTQ